MAVLGDEHLVLDLDPQPADVGTDERLDREDHARVDDAVVAARFP